MNIPLVLAFDYSWGGGGGGGGGFVVMNMPWVLAFE